MLPSGLFYALPELLALSDPILNGLRFQPYKFGSLLHRESATASGHNLIGHLVCIG